MTDDVSTGVGEAAGVASAPDASVLIGTYSSAELEAALAASRERDAAELPAKRIEGLTAKRDKFAAHLAEAERALAEEIAAQAAAGGTE